MASSPKTSPKIRPDFSERMSLGPGLDAFAPPSSETTWTDSHHRHTLWLSDELWEAMNAYVATEPDLSKSNLVEREMRKALGMAPDE